MPELPRGTVTFLFTDIEGSTRLWEEQPEAMREALARHDTLLRAAIEQHGGSVFKTAGDAFYAAFATAREAVAAALSAQNALIHEADPSHSPLGHRLKVRMALHTGEAEPRDGDYFGQPLNRVARLLDAGSGGQVLISAVTEELVREALPTGVGLRDLGSHRLRDLQPERVYQLLHAGLPDDFPPLRSLEAQSTNLRQPLTTFIGREGEMEEVKRLLAETRLLTLTGAGGCGKTRLAMQVAADATTAYRDGVWFVDLAALTDPSLVPQAAASVIGVREEPGKSLAQTLVTALQQKHLLMLLDNCEHLIEACARLAEMLLRGCPNVRILATSREALGIAGETTWRVPSLALSEAEQLFMERATAAAPAFAVTRRNRPALAKVCARLDGIPLAIELAAARVRVLTVEQIAGRLDDRFRLLTGGSRTALPRQQTLEALVDWSYDLLLPEEKALLRRLSVFSGGWTLEAAEAVCAGPPLQERELLDLLTHLVDKSLVMFEQSGDEGRYRLLETVRQYASERLLEAGEAEPLRDRHRGFYAELAEQAEPHLSGRGQTDWLARLAREHDNMRYALLWSFEGEVRLRLAAALHRYWLVRGHLTEGRAWLEGALARAGGVSEPVLAKALNGAGILAWAQGDIPAAQERFQRSLELQRKAGNARGTAAALCNLGILAGEQGDFPAAREHYEESLQIYRQLDDRARMSIVLANLGGIALDEGDLETAAPLFEESLAIHRQAGDRGSAAATLYNLGKIALLHGDPEAADRRHRESLTLRQQLGDLRGSALSMIGLGVAAGIRGHHARATRLLGAAEAIREAVAAPLPSSEQADYDRQAARLRAALGEEAFRAAWEAGRAMSPDEAIALALQHAD